MIGEPKGASTYNHSRGGEWGEGGLNEYSLKRTGRGRTNVEKKLGADVENKGLEEGSGGLIRERNPISA